MNYKKLNELFPQIMDRTHEYERYESKSFEPLSLEWIGENQLSIMHTYVQNGDLMRDPEIVVNVDDVNEEVNAVSFEQSSLGMYREYEENSRGQRETNSFMKSWLKNISSQGYELVKENDTEIEAQSEDKYRIYQIKSGEEYRDIRFEGSKYLSKNNIVSNVADYDEKYSGSLEDIEGEDKLESIYEKFNIDRPDDFTGHSLSVSDVVVIESSGSEKAYLVDSFGFTEVPDFFKEREVIEETAEKAEYREKVSSIYEYEVKNSVPDNERMTNWSDNQPVPTAKPEYMDGIGISEKHIEQRYDEIQNEKAEKTVLNSVELGAGDIIEAEGRNWRVDKIDGDFAIYLTNTDKDDIMSCMSYIGHWKDKLDYTLIEKATPEKEEPSFSQLSLFDAMEEAVSAEPAANLPIIEEAAASVDKNDFTITEDTQSGGAKEKYHNNVEAIRTLRTIEAENRLAAPDEQAVLAKYVGWGGLSQALLNKPLGNPNTFNQAVLSSLCQ